MRGGMGRREREEVDESGRVAPSLQAVRPTKARSTAFSATFRSCLMSSASYTVAIPPLTEFGLDAVAAL